MIELVFNHADFEYDVYGLVQAFFPREELETVYDVPDDEADHLPYQSRKRRVQRDTEKKDQNTGETAGKKKETDGRMHISIFLILHQSHNCNSRFQIFW